MPGTLQGCAFPGKGCVLAVDGSRLRDTATEEALKTSEPHPLRPKLPQQAQDVSHWLAPRPLWQASRGNLAPSTKKIVWCGPAAPERLHDPLLQGRPVGSQLIIDLKTAAPILVLSLLMRFPQLSQPSHPLGHLVHYLRTAFLCLSCTLPIFECGS